jgi:hypothetical protein
MTVIPLYQFTIKLKIIMALELKKYEGGSSELTSLGTVVETTGVKGSIKTLRKNFQDTSKRVAVIIANAKGESTVVSCSAALSVELRAGRIVADDLFGYEIVEGDAGIPFISMPTEGSVQEFKASNYKAKAKPSLAFMPTSAIG